MRSSAPRRAFSVVEAVFAFAMLGGMLGVLMQFFLGTQRQAMGSEQKLNSALLAQMVMERIRSQSSINPAFFKELGMTAGTWTSTGTVVDPAAANPAAGTAISPFFEYLFLREGTDLYTAANRIAMPAPPPGPPADPATDPAGARRRAMVEAFRDYRVDVKVEDDVALDASPTAATLREMVKKITVTVSRGSVIARAGTDAAAVTLTSRLVTPPESLSDAAVQVLNNNFDNASVLVSAQEEFFQTAGDAAYLSEDYLGKRRTLIADCYMMLSAVNTEAYFVEKATISGGFTIDDRKPVKSMNEWLLELKQPFLYQHAAFKKQVARVNRMKALQTFDAFRRVLPLLEDLNAGHQAMLVEVEDMTAMLRQTQEKILNLNNDTLESMRSYKDNLRKKADAEKALTDLEKKQLDVDKVKLDADKLLADYELLKIKYDDLVAANAPTNEIDDAKRDRDRKKSDWEDKKRDFDEKQREVTDSVTRETGKRDTAANIINTSLTAINSKMSDFAALTTASGKDLLERLQLVVVCKFMNDFFQNATYLPIVNRIRSYPAQFRAALDGSREALRDLIKPDGGATPLEATLAVQDLVEVEKTRMLERGVDDASIRSELDSLLEAQGSRLREATKYAKASELRNWPALSARNARFLERLSILKNMADPANPANTYENIVKHYGPGGKIKVFLDTYTQVTSEIALNSGSMLVQLNRDIQGQRNDLSLIGNATLEEILRAMPTNP